jgi:hypothetical protein
MYKFLPDITCLQIRHFKSMQTLGHSGIKLSSITIAYPTFWYSHCPQINFQWPIIKINLFFSCVTQASPHRWLLGSFSIQSAWIGVSVAKTTLLRHVVQKSNHKTSRSKIHKYLIEPHVKASAYPASPPHVKGEEANTFGFESDLKLFGKRETNRLEVATPPPTHTPTQRKVQVWRNMLTLFVCFCQRCLVLNNYCCQASGNR